MKILIIRSGAIGDVIMATPFVRNVKENYPNSIVSFLVGKWSSGVLKNNPNVDEIISFDDEIIIKKQILKLMKLIKKLRQMKFDMCFVLDKSWMWGLFAYLLRIKVRIGFSRGNEGIFHTESVKFLGEKNEVDYNLDLVEKIGIKSEKYKPEIFTTLEDKKNAAKAIAAIKDNKKKIGLCPGGAVNPGQRALIKRWPVSKYVELTEEINANYLIFGSNDDKAIAQEIISKSGNKAIYDLTGMSIFETKELMEKCDVIITHDSGALHIASTTSTKIIALFGPTPAKRFAPKNAIVVSKGKPCYNIYGRFGKDNDNMGKIDVSQIRKYI